jgi:large subunit ribosomal protein L6
MSRIGERKLTIPEGVEVEISGNTVIVKGKNSELKLDVNPMIEVVVEDGIVKTKQRETSKRANVLQGTTNSLIGSMLTGVSKGFEKGLEAVGVGYRFNVQGNKITVSAGYSHPVEVIVPEGLTAELVSTTEITIKGTNKQKVSEFAANIRKIREPEPYKGKGIRYKGEYVRRKEGKKAA